MIEQMVAEQKSQYKAQHLQQPTPGQGKALRVLFDLHHCIVYRVLLLTSHPAPSRKLDTGVSPCC